MKTTASPRGLLLVDKPAGPTSHDVVASVRRQLGIRRVGHTGTLDPFASGLLVVLVGSATRLSRFVSAADKSYEGVIELGSSTDTLDNQGTVVSRSTVPAFDQRKLDELAASFLGPSLQTPPAYSARKVGGVRAYKLAREGKEVSLEQREVRVERFALEARSASQLGFRVKVSSGTYVRALARDVGVALNTDARLTSLRRTSVGPFAVTDAVDIEGVSRDCLRPAAEAVGHLNSLRLGEEEVRWVRHGRALSAEGEADGYVALMENNDLVAVGKVESGSLRPEVVLAE